MQIVYLPNKSYYFSVDPTAEYGEKAVEREKKLLVYKKLVSGGCNKKTALETIDISLATYKRWNRAYHNSGIEGLIPKTRDPNTYRKPEWKAALEKLVAKLRNKHLVWGKAKITVLLKRDFGIKVSESTVGRILKKLVLLRKVHPVSFFTRPSEPKKKRKFNKHAERWTYGMKSRKPGELVQIDHMVVKDFNGKELRQFSAICPFTKIIFEQVYTRATAASANDFLKQARNAFPFPVLSAQVDGGSEFMAEFETGCKDSGIPLFVLPPRRPKYNGCVERSHGTVRNEFYALYPNLTSLAIIRTELQKYVHLYNTFRPHQSIKYKTPWQFWQNFKGAAGSNRLN